MQQINFIDLKKQQERIIPQIEEKIQTVLRHGRYILGPEVKELEQQLAEYVGVKHCLGVSSGTDALLMPLMAWDIGPGDAVFTTPFTFIATAEVIQLLGATPFFVDIDPQTFNIDPKQLALAIEAVQKNDPSIYPLPYRENNNPLSPKVIIPVDLFGLPADYDPIMELAAQHDLFVLADSAQGFGGEYKGKKAGSLGHAATTSFFPAKPLGCYGDGGAIFTDNDELFNTLESIRVHGKGRDKYDNIRVGLNARLHTIQAAILLAKLQIFPDELVRKQAVAEQYTANLSTTTDLLTLPYVPQGMQSAWAQYSLLADTEELREQIQAALKEKGIPSMVYYNTPLHVQTAFAHLNYQTEDFPNSMDTAFRIFSLPMHAYLSKEDIQCITTAIEQTVN
ncbi:MAG: DegT/DnrJ/EryC1/StrS family aminotransferase [Candidatus Electrothrix sp. EH2]|nr:DegT/DnrJ/EryC1/StrS family aminotransferase [Candidatus Electrothrix sp. EH2]